MATKGSDNWPLLTTHCHSMPPCARTLANILIRFISLETRVPGKHFYRGKCRSMFICFHIVVAESGAEKSSQTNNENKF